MALNVSNINPYVVNYSNNIATEGAVIFNFSVGRQIVALRDSNDSNVGIDLLLGATGDMYLNVAGSQNVKITTANDETTSIQTIGNRGFEFISDNRVTLGDVEIYHDADNKQHFWTAMNEIQLSNQVTVSGAGVVLGDLVAGGTVETTDELAVIRTYDNNKKVGFGFRITDDQNLELVKFDNVRNVTKRVAVLGKGEASVPQNDTTAYVAFSSNTVDTSRSNLTSTLSAGPITLPPWVTIAPKTDNSIVYYKGNVGIGTSVANYLLDLSNGTARTSNLIVRNSAIEQSHTADRILYVNAENEIVSSGISELLLTQNPVRSFYNNGAVLYVDGNKSVGLGTSSLSGSNALEISGNMRIAGDILPASNSVYSLGDSNNRFGEAFISPNTVYIGDIAIKSTSNGELQVLKVNPETGETTLNTAVDFVFPFSNNIGLNVATPSNAKLHVLHDASSDITSFLVDKGDISSDHLFSVRTNGKVGVGSTSVFTPALLVSGTSNNLASGMSVGASSAFNVDISNGLIVQGNVGVGITNPAAALFVDNLPIGLGYQTSTAPTNGVCVQSNVGIGVSIPVPALHVGGTATAGVAIGSGATFNATIPVNTLAVQGAIAVETTNPGSAALRASNLVIGATTATYNTTPIANGLMIQGNFGIGTVSASGAKLRVGSSNGMTIGSGYNVVAPTNGLAVQGNLGCGKTNPGYTVDVVGDINFSGSFNQNGTMYVNSQFTTTSVTKVFYTTGNVGFGITNPTFRLDTNSNLSANMLVAGLDSNTSTALNTSNAVSIRPGNTTYTIGTLTSTNNGLVKRVRLNTPGSINTGSQTVSVTKHATMLWNNSRWDTEVDEYSQFSFSSNGEQLSITGSNIGIGTTQPEQRLDVVGDIQTNGVLYRNGTLYNGDPYLVNNSSIYNLGSNIGIGTSQPRSNLDVNGTVLLNNGDALVTNDLTVDGNLTVNGELTIVNTTQLLVADPIVTVNGDDNSLAGLEIERGDSSNYYFALDQRTSPEAFKVGTSNDLQTVATRDSSFQNEGVPFWKNDQLSGTDKFVVNSTTGYVGIGGTTTPGYTLDITGDIRTTSRLLQNNEHYLQSFFVQGSSSNHVVLSDGSNLSIGTTSAGDDSNGLYVSGDIRHDTLGANKILVTNVNKQISLSSSVSSKLPFLTGSSSNVQENINQYLSISSGVLSGTLGIGTTVSTPDYSLYVNGDLKRTDFVNTNLNKIWVPGANASWYPTTTATSLVLPSGAGFSLSDASTHYLYTGGSDLEYNFQIEGTVTSAPTNPGDDFFIQLPYSNVAEAGLQLGELHLKVNNGSVYRGQAIATSNPLQARLEFISGSNEFRLGDLTSSDFIVIQGHLYTRPDNSDLPPLVSNLVVPRSYVNAELSQSNNNVSVGLSNGIARLNITETDSSVPALFVNTIEDGTSVSLPVLEVIGKTKPMFSVLRSGKTQIGNSLYVASNLYVGRYLVYDTTNLSVGESNLQLGTSVGNPDSGTLGLEIFRGSSNTAFVVFDETDGFFKVGLSNQLDTVATVGSANDSNALIWNGDGFIANRDLFIGTNAEIGVGTSSPSATFDLFGEVRLDSTAGSETIEINNVFNLTNGDLQSDSLIGTSVLGVASNQDKLVKSLNNVTVTELNQLSGLNANLNTQIATKENNLTGAVSELSSSNLTAGKVLVTDGSGKVVVSTASDIELEYAVSGLSGSVMSYLTPKVDSSINGISDISGSITTGRFDASNDLNVSGQTVISGNVVVSSGNFVLNDNTTLNTEETLIRDNLITVNNTSSAPQVGQLSGIEIERGDLSNYYFVYEEGSNESSGGFKIGMSNSLQKVATRSTSIENGSVAVWNSSLYQLESVSQLTHSNGVVSARQLETNTLLYQPNGLSVGSVASHLSSNASIYTFSTSNLFLVASSNLYLQNENADRFRFNMSNQELNCVGDLTGFDTALASDLRLKTGIQEEGVRELALSTIEKLQPVSYEWKYHSRPREAGFIAQDVATFAPELVNYNTTNQAYAVKYSRIVPYLVSTIQTLKERIEKQRQSILEKLRK
jgi:hypothetical protein